MFVPDNIHQRNLQMHFRPRKGFVSDHDNNREILKLFSLKEEVHIDLYYTVPLSEGQGLGSR
jgi:hypothetical protein